MPDRGAPAVAVGDPETGSIGPGNGDAGPHPASAREPQGAGPAAAWPASGRA